MWKDIIQTFIIQNRFYKQTGRVTDITKINIKNRVESLQKDLEMSAH